MDRFYFDVEYTAGDVEVDREGITATSLTEAQLLGLELVRRKADHTEVVVVIRGEDGLPMSIVSTCIAFALTVLLAEPVRSRSGGPCPRLPCALIC
jgi:hypothetical protein